MYTIVLLACTSFVFSLLLTPICRDLFGRFAVDQPDCDRKLHVRPVPRIGGIPIALSYLASYAVLFIMPFEDRSALSSGISFARQLIPPAGLIFAIGLSDDFFRLKPWHKLIGQTLAAVAAYGLGIRILAIAGHSTQSWWSMPLTIVWLVACTNAFNLIDGLDGFASGVGLFASVTTLIAAVLQPNIPLVLATVPLAACLLGFLRYNFNPASIFLGDSGSLLIGFLLGCFSVIWSQKSATLLGMTAPALALAVPMLDMVLSISRRFLRRQPIFRADRGHIHHRLLDRGLTPRRAALVLYAASGLAAVLSLLQSLEYRGGIVIVIFCVATWIGIQQLKYGEFTALARLITARGLRHRLNAQLDLELFEQSLASAKSVIDCWDIISRSYTKFGFWEVRLSISGSVREARLQNAFGANSWTLHISLIGSDYIALTREHESPAVPISIAAFADAVRNAFMCKYGQFDSGTEFLKLSSTESPSRERMIATAAKQCKTDDDSCPVFQDHL
jgi:UDP-GlcNAc:undecaprenyl-phosphate GlcNAc-1-phosphate transferase